MKVRELIDLLAKMNPERVVVLQKDAEGNGYSPLRGADDNARYLARCTWDGEVKRETLTDEDGATKRVMRSCRPMAAEVAWLVSLFSTRFEA